MNMNNTARNIISVFRNSDGNVALVDSTGIVTFNADGESFTSTFDSLNAAGTVLQSLGYTWSSNQYA